MLAEKLAKRESGRHRRDRHSEKISILNNIRMVLIVIIELNVVFFVNSNCTKVAARRLVKDLASDLFFFEKQW